MGNLLYLDGTCGISGDMFVGALLGLGGSEGVLRKALKNLEDEFEIEISKDKSYSIEGYNFNVILKNKHHDDHHCEHHHVHRHLSDIYSIIDKANLSPRASNLAKRIFEIVAKAESEAHGIDINEVHFHEVGAIDSIVDIISASVLIDELNISGCVVTNLTEGQGFVTCQHGDLPVPVPAVLNILREYKIPLSRSNTSGEMITPTGIAILAALNPSFALSSNYTISNIGIGLGKRDFGRPNILRAMFIDTKQRSEDEDNIIVIETNIDNDTAENLSFAMEKLFEAGARDVYIIPCYMKKNRAGNLLGVIADKRLLDDLTKIIFTHTQTIGIRYYDINRICMNKEYSEVETENYGKIKIKTCEYGDIKKVYPEYESLKEASEKFRVPLSKIKRDIV